MFHKVQRTKIKITSSFITIFVIWIKTMQARKVTKNVTTRKLEKMFRFMSCHFYLKKCVFFFSFSFSLSNVKVRGLSFPNFLKLYFLFFYSKLFCFLLFSTLFITYKNYFFYHNRRFSLSLYIYIYIYILSSTDRLFRSIRTLLCG